LKEEVEEKEQSPETSITPGEFPIESCASTVRLPWIMPFPERVAEVDDAAPITTELAINVPAFKIRYACCWVYTAAALVRAKVEETVVLPCATTLVATFVVAFFTQKKLPCNKFKVPEIVLAEVRMRDAPAFTVTPVLAEAEMLPLKLKLPEVEPELDPLPTEKVD